MELKSLVKSAGFRIKSAFNALMGNENMAGLAMLLGGGFTWGSDYAGSYRNKVVYSAVNLLVRKLTETPIIVSMVKSEKQFKSFMKTVSPERLKASKELSMDELDEHPFLDLWNMPNDYQTSLDLQEDFWFNVILHRDGGYLFFERSGADDRRPGRIVAVHSLPSWCVTPMLSRDWRNPVEYYQFFSWTGEMISISPNNILNIRGWNPSSQTIGFSFQDSTFKTIAQNEANQEGQGAAFRNGGTGILLSSDTAQSGVNKDIVDKISPDQMKQVADTIKRNMSGFQNTKAINFTNGYVNVQKLGDTLVDLASIDAEKSNWKDIYTVLGIPIVLGPTAEAMTESNVVAGFKALVTNTIVPMLRKFDEKLNRYVGKDYEGKIRICHDVTEFTELAPDLKLMKETYGEMWQITPNELRNIFNFDRSEDPNMDKIYIKTGLSPLDSINEDISLDPDAKQYDYN